MIRVSAFVGYDQPLIRQALNYLRSEHKVMTCVIEEQAEVLEQYAVFAMSEGNYPGRFLKTLFAPTIEEQAERLQQIKNRGYTVLGRALKSSHIILLKKPTSGSEYVKDECVRFYRALDQACELQRKTPSLQPAEAERRRGVALAAHRERKRESRQDNVR